MKHILPARESDYATRRLEFFLKLALRKRQKEGMELSPVQLSPRKGRGCLGVSDLAKPACALWYHLNGYLPEEADEGSQFGLDTGHVLESYILDILEIPRSQRQVALSWPYPPAPGGRIWGHPDAFFQGPLPGTCVIECKATGGYAFSKRLEEGPETAHFHQAFCYAAKLGARWFAVIYANREAKKATAFYKVFAWEVNDAALARKAARGLFHAGFLPVLMASCRPDPPEKPRYEFGPRGWRCRPDRSYLARGKKVLQVGYCGFRHVCPEAASYRQALDEVGASA